MGDDNAEQFGRPKRWDTFTLASLLFNGILALTAVVGIVYVRQELKLTRESNDLTRQALLDAHESRVAERLADDEARRDSQLALESTLAKMQDSNNVSRETLIASQRAWLVFTRPHTEPAFEVDKEFRVAVSIKNSGPTPALIIEQNWNSQIRRGGVVEFTPDFGRILRIGRGIVVDDYPLTALRKHRISQARLDEIRAGRFTLFAYGYVTYSDMFGTHRTSACFWWDPNVAPNGDSMKSCPFYYSAE